MTKNHEEELKLKLLKEREKARKEQKFRNAELEFQRLVERDT